ncbi:PAS domain-containing protein [Bacillus subtilis subsp. subtilis]|nr:PAS domain-containing protein [Bacillus subtilis subsp. subtilis]
MPHEDEHDTAKWRIYEALLQATPDLSYVFDLQHRFIYANKALLDMWGLRWEDAIGKTCLELGYEPWHARMHDEEIDRVVATARAVRGEVPFPHKTEGTRVYDYIFTPVLGPEGQVEAVAGSTRDITERTRHAQHLQLLVNELNHRVNNTLATVLSIARQTFANAEGMDDACGKIEERLLALSSAHDVLTRENWRSADIADLAHAVAAQGRCDARQFRVQGEACRIDPRRAVALAMALHELRVNAARHGALTTPQGTVQIVWHRCRHADGEVVELLWRERGGPQVQPPAQRGFGSRLLERGLKHDVGGSVDLAFEPEGVSFRVSIPLPDDAHEVYP